MRNYYKVILAGIILSLSLSGCYFLPEEEEVLAIPEVEGSVTNGYATYTVEKGDIINSVECLATFTPSEYESFVFTKSDRLKKIYPHLGDLVKKGDILAEIETGNLEYQLPKIRIDLQKKAIQMEELKKDWGRQLKDKKGQKETIEQNYRLAEEDYALKKELFKTQMASQREVDEAKIKRDNFKNERDKLDEEIMDLDKNLSGKELSGELKIAQLDYEAMQLELSQMEKEIELSKIVATMDGRVVFVNEEVKNGEYVPAFKEMIRIASLENYYLEYTGDNASAFKQGDKVNINYLEKDYEGVVSMTPLSLSNEEASKFKDTIRFSFVETDDTIKSLQQTATATVSFIRNEKKGVLIIPRSAMKTVQGKNIVYILQDGVRVKREIEPGLEDVTNMEVKKGLKEGDQIIIQ